MDQLFIIRAFNDEEIEILAMLKIAFLEDGVMSSGPSSVLERWKDGEDRSMAALGREVVQVINQTAQPQLRH